MNLLLEKDGVWKEKGIILVPDNEKMRIDLLGGWQNQQARVQPYRLGLEDRKSVNSLDKKSDSGGVTCRHLLKAEIDGL